MLSGEVSSPKTRRPAPLAPRCPYVEERNAGVLS